MNHIKNRLKHIGRSLLHWTWTKGLLFWIIISAGTLSELAFLLASMWKSIDASDHSFVLLFMTQKMSENVGYFASSAYILLPVCILPLGVVTTYTHFRTWVYGRKFVHGSGIWFVLYGLPTLTFLIIDICIISNSNGDHYVLPDILTSIRSDMAYAYGLTAILYHYIGKKQEVERLKEKDDFISELVEQARLLTEQIDGYKAKMEQVYKEKETAIQEKSRLYSALIQTSEDALQAYGETVIEWLNGLDKTVDVDDITAHTGINKRRLQHAIDKGELRIRGTNKSRLRVPSLKEYLVNNAPKVAAKAPISVTSNGHSTPDTEPIDISDYTEMSS